MMKQTLHITSWMMVLAAALTVTGCTMGDEEISDSLPSDGDVASGVNVSLTLSIPSNSHASRAVTNPSGGEDGDGKEAGQTYEDEIQDLTVFFYPSSGATDRTTVTASAYFANTQLTPTTRGYKTHSVAVHGLNEGTTYGVLVIANTGDVRNALGTTVGDVRNYELKRYPWTQTDATYSRFVMSSEAGNETLTIPSAPTGDKGSEENPYTLDNDASVSLERLAARVDYRTDASTFTVANSTSGTVTIQKAALVNRLNGTEAGTYFIKRVAETVDGTVTYYGDETTDANGVATNYVIEPLTAAKTAVTDDTYNAEDWEKYFDNYFRTYGDGIAQNWQDRMTAGTVITDESNVDWTRVDYAVENTVGKDNQDSRFVTGIVFSAQFVPTGLSGYTEGQTFFEYNGKLYATLTSLMNAYEGSTNWKPDAAALQGMTWRAVKDYANALAANDPTGYRNYLAQTAEEHIDAYDETVGADAANSLTWEAYMLAQHGYNETDGAPVITYATDATVNTRRSLSTYGVRTYENGICYYTYWIKHANDGDDTAKGIMEHAIVRNNIYKIQITGVRDLGDDIPSEDDHKLSIVVAVKDWNLLNEENFEF